MGDIRKRPWPQQRELSSWTEAIVGGGGRRKRQFGTSGGGDTGVGRGSVPPGTHLSTRERQRERGSRTGAQLSLWGRCKGLCRLWDTRHSRRNTLFFKELLPPCPQGCPHTHCDGNFLTKGSGRLPVPEEGAEGRDLACWAPLRGARKGVTLAPGVGVSSWASPDPAPQS